MVRKNLFCVFILVGIISLLLLTHAKADCIGATYNFICGDTINESCTMNESEITAGACFTIGASDISIDGAGYNITGDYSTYGAYGIYNDGTYSNITIKNTTIDGFDYGINFYGGSNHNITNNIIQSNLEYGIYLDNSGDSGGNNTIDTNNVYLNYYGIYLYYSADSNITNNNVSYSTSEGIYLTSVQGNVISNILDNNLQGIGVYSSNNFNISLNNITNSLDMGIYSDASSYNNISNNIIENSVSNGVYLTGTSNDNIILKNNISISGDTGIYLTDSSNNTILDNNISNNLRGMYLYGDSLSNAFYYNSLDLNTNGLVFAGFTTGIGIFKVYHYPSINYFYNFEIPSTSDYNTITKTNYFINSSEISNFTSIIGTIYWGWYIDAYVNDTDNNLVENAKVFSYDYSNELFISNYTNSSGFTNLNDYWEYKRVNSTINYINNYTFIATKNGLSSNLSYVNLSGNMLNDNLTLTLNLNSKKCVGTNYNFTCGDIVNESCIMDGNITSLGTCFYIEDNNLILDGNNYTIFGLFDKGINLSETAIDNVTIQNLKITNFTTGIYISSSTTNSVIQRCEIYSNTRYGIYLDSSSTDTLFDNDVYNNPENQINLNLADGNNISNNRLYGGNSVININYADNNIFYKNNINSSNFGVYASMTSSTNNLSDNNFYNLTHNLYWIFGTGNRIENNTFFDNVDLFNGNEPSIDDEDPFAIISGNKIRYNEITYIELPNDRNLDFTRTFFNFSITLSNYTNTSYFILNSLKIYPNATLVYTNTSNAINGYFIPIREGLYALVLNVTDDQNNEITHTYYYSNTTKLKYYYRSDIPTNGQPTGGVADTGTLLLNPPISDETRYCTNWIQFSFDNKSNSLEQGFKKITGIESYYRYTGNGNCQFGIQDKVDYGSNINDEKTIGLQSDPTIFNQTNFYEKYIMSDSDQQWLNLSMKMQCSAGDTLTLYTNQTNPSYLNLSYIYTTNPIINDIDDNSFLYSATSLPNINSSIIQLYGIGEITLNVTMKNQDNYLVYLNGVLCPNTNCTYNTTDNQTINLTLGINGLDNLSITSLSENITNFSIPQTVCSDGTAEDSCSSDKPSYCSNGVLVSRCSTCGCDSGHYCKSDGNCAIRRSNGGSSGGSSAVCGNGFCDSGETYLNCTKDCPAPSNPPEKIDYYCGNLSEKDCNLNISSKEVIKFNVRGIEHIAQIDGITSESINIWIWSEPKMISLNIGESRQLDLNGNNLADLEITLNSIINQTVSLTFEELNETQIVESPIGERPSVSMWPILLVICLLLILVLVVIFTAKHHKKNRSYGYK